MKNRVLFLLFLCLLICVSDGFDGFEEKVGNPDDTAIIERPCPVYDIECIREYFAKHSNCIKTYGPVPDPYYRSQSTLYNPRTNMTINIINQELRGLNGRIEEFYINKDTNNLVIAIEFTGLVLTVKDYPTAPNDNFRFHRVAKEPVVTSGAAFVQYNSVVITAVIPNYEHIQLDKAESTAFANDSNPPTTVTPSAAESNDPQVQLAVAQFLANLATNVQEQFLNDAPYFLATYIQYNICDFGMILV